MVGNVVRIAASACHQSGTRQAAVGWCETHVVRRATRASYIDGVAVDDVGACGVHAGGIAEVEYGAAGNRALLDDESSDVEGENKSPVYAVAQVAGAVLPFC